MTVLLPQILQLPVNGFETFHLKNRRTLARRNHIKNFIKKKFTSYVKFKKLSFWLSDYSLR